MKLHKLFLFLILGIYLPTFSQYKIIPEPVSIQYTDFKFIVTKQIKINTKNNALDFEINYLKQLLEKKGYTVILNDKQKIKALEININLENTISQLPESYELKCYNNDIILYAFQKAGIYYGIQTIDQIFPYFSENEKLTNCTITDYPKYEWRGLMLDVSRHFFNIDEVKSYIDLMSRYKFNVFHWHLTDDEGWRVEIKSLPKLTEIGAWRAQRTGKFRTREAPTAVEPKTYGGFYTQDQIKEVIAYGNERHITIVPEIDVPGHSMALLAAYPELSTKKEPKMVSCGFKFSEWYGEGKFKMLVENTLNPSDENVYTTLDKIYTEIAELFPSDYIHIGGDEAYHGYWEEDANCKKFMIDNNLKNSLELQSYFMKRIEKIISSKGKKMIGWDEILYGGLADGAAVMSWQGMKGGIEAAKSGHKVVMTPTQFCYLDYVQGDKSIEETVYADLSLKKSYEFDPLPVDVDPKLILGGQGNLWTEQVPNLSHAFYMTYPRALALSESLWSTFQSKNWNNFSSKIDYHFSIFDKEEIEICKAVYDPIIKLYKDGDKMMCELSCETPNTEIFYTLNSSFPNKKSSKYSVPFEIPNTKVVFRATTFRNGKPLGRLLNIPKVELDKRIK